MSNIYRQHEAAFSNVSAYVVLHEGKPVAKVAFKFPKDGAGRVYAYVHWLGVTMQRGFAGGGGYDKRSAAVSAAVSKMPEALPDTNYADGTPHHPMSERLSYRDFYDALTRDEGRFWDDRLRSLLFDVVQAV